MSLKQNLANAVLGDIQPQSTIGTSNQAVRETWLKSQLESIPSGHRILDAGAGTTRYRKYCEHLKYVSQDFGQYDGQGDGEGLQTGSLISLCWISFATLSIFQKKLIRLMLSCASKFWSMFPLLSMR